MHTANNSVRRARVALTVAASLALSLTAVAPAAAQNADSRWAPWIGCWAPHDTIIISLSGRGASDRVVCVSPATTGSGVDMASIVSGRVISRERVEANGQRVTKTVDGCPGWESADWSKDGRRVLLRSEFVCNGNVTRKESGVLGMSGSGEWLDVQGVDVMGSTAVRVARLHEARVELELVSPRAGALGDSVRLKPVEAAGFSRETVRLQAGGRVSADDVLDVAKRVDAPVTEAWLVEVGQPFALDAKTLVRLSDAGMPARTLDLMVALSYPKTFALNKANPGDVDRVRTNRPQGAYAGGAPGRGFGYNQFSCAAYNDMMFAYGRLGRSYYNDGCYGSFLGSRYYGNSFGYGNYYWGNNPIIIVQNPGSGSGSAAQAQGRAVNGRGYTRDPSFPASGSSGGTGGTVAPRESSGSSGTGGGGDTGGGGSGRTAKARGG